MNKTNYRLNLKNDYVFKMMHYVDEEIGKKIFASMVEAFLGIRPISIQFAPNEMNSPSEDGKEVRYDLHAKINTKDAIDVEMQMSNMIELTDRAGYYVALLYSRQSIRGQAYRELANAHCVFLCGNNVFHETEESEHHFMMMDRETGIVLTSKMKAHIIEMKKELAKIKEIEELTMKQKWIVFLMEYEENTRDTRMMRLIESEEIFEKAVEVLKVISEDEVMRERAYARQKNLMDEAQFVYETKEKIKQAREEGIEQGRLEEKLEASENLLKRNIDVELISESLKLPIEKVLEIKRSLKINE